MYSTHERQSPNVSHRFPQSLSKTTRGNSCKIVGPRERNTMQRTMAGDTSGGSKTTRWEVHRRQETRRGSTETDGEDTKWKIAQKTGRRGWKTRGGAAEVRRGRGLVDRQHPWWDLTYGSGTRENRKALWDSRWKKMGGVWTWRRKEGRKRTTKARRPRRQWKCPRLATAKTKHTHWFAHLLLSLVQKYQFRWTNISVIYSFPVTKWRRIKNIGWTPPEAN